LPSALNKMSHTTTERRTDLPHVSRLFLTLGPRSRGISDVLLLVFSCNHTITSAIINIAITHICNHTHSTSAVTLTSTITHTHTHTHLQAHICNLTHTHTHTHTRLQSHTHTHRNHTLTSAITHSHRNHTHTHICKHTHIAITHTHICKHTPKSAITQTHTHIAITREQPGCYFCPSFTRHVPQTHPCVW